MIESIIEWSIRNRFLVILASLVLGVAGFRALMTMPVDAIPDLSENQVIVFTDWMGRSPQEIEDQITYPLSVNLQGLAGVKVVRSSSEFNFSMITIIFDDATDYYFARQRVLERLSIASTFLPPGVTPYLAPDATAVGQIFWYTVEGEGKDLGELRSIQDWYVRYQLNSVPGVAEVASVGGAPSEYQIDLDPNKLRAYGISLGEVYSAVARSNSSVGGRVDPPGERRVPDPLGRLDREPRRHPRDRRRPAQERHADLRRHARHGPGRARIPPQRPGEGRQGGRRRRGADALRREPAGGHAPGQGEDHHPPGGAARGRADRPVLRPHPADPQGARDRQRHGQGGADRLHDRHPPGDGAPGQRLRRRDHAADGDPVQLPDDAAVRHVVEHHEPGRHLDQRRAS